jgi:hypothetical protein
LFTVPCREGKCPKRFPPIQIRYSEYPVCFQYVDDFWHLLFAGTLYIVSFAYARLRSAQRIKCPPQAAKNRGYLRDGANV